MKQQTLVTRTSVASVLVPILQFQHLFNSSIHFSVANLQTRSSTSYFLLSLLTARIS